MLAGVHRNSLCCNRHQHQPMADSSLQGKQAGVHRRRQKQSFAVPSLQPMLAGQIHCVCCAESPLGLHYVLGIASSSYNNTSAAGITVYTCAAEIAQCPCVRVLRGNGFAEGKRSITCKGAVSSSRWTSLWLPAMFVTTVCFVITTGSRHCCDSACSNAATAPCTLKASSPADPCTASGATGPRAGCC